MIRLFLFVLSICITTAFLATGGPITAEPILGKETGLPLPRYVSIKAGKAFLRRGPSTTHRIDWVYERRDLPLQVIGEFGHWRKVMDFEGVTGWMHYALLSGNRTVIVATGPTTIYDRPNTTSRPRAELAQGVIADLGQCLPDWCHLRVDGHSGWAAKSALWGVDADELRD